MRELQGSHDQAYESPYFEVYDVDGDAYSLAWRYLGVYIDTNDEYSRKVLWAAYYDPNYSRNENGEYNQIGEYSFYDWTTQAWDTSTCSSSGSCTQMNCHDTNSTNWELAGVYKSSLGFDNDSFYEQLFKHQGYCLWTSSSDYSFMQAMRGEMGDPCQYVDNNLYIGIKPTEGGNITQALYSDSSCENESSAYSVDEYVSRDCGSVEESFDKWNTLMEAYKTCQSCRAYSSTSNTDSSWQQHRDLVEYYDGVGAEETNGFNCYDDAGYRNCNQCYKFDTHAGMEEASDSDLQLASGTILGISVDGVYYGSQTTTESNSYTTTASSSYTTTASNSYTTTASNSYATTASNSHTTTASNSYYAYGGSIGIVSVVIAVAARFTGSRFKRRIVVNGDQLLDQPVLQAQED